MGPLGWYTNVAIPPPRFQLWQRKQVLKYRNPIYISALQILRSIISCIFLPEGFVLGLGFPRPEYLAHDRPGAQVLYPYRCSVFVQSAEIFQLRFQHK